MSPLVIRMINDKVQKQESGDNSTNIQAQNVVLNAGISYADAKEIALDVYRDNFLKLSQDAANLAIERAEHLTDKFLEKLRNRNANAVDSVKEPSMQAAIYEAQKHYAISGDKDIEDLLVDILVDRAEIPERNLRQIVLDESISIASKLTLEQMDALTLNFIFLKTSYTQMHDLSKLREYLEHHVLPFLDSLKTNTSCYEHLEYLGCGATNPFGGSESIENIFHSKYAGLFSRGFSEEHIRGLIPDYARYPNLLTRCLHDGSLIQIAAMNVQVLDEMLKQNQVPENLIKIYVSLFNDTRKIPQDIKKIIIDMVPGVERLFSLWSQSGLSRFSITTVGVAIAQANFRRKTGVKLDLGIWVK